MMKARNASPTAQMQKCDVVEQGKEMVAARYPPQQCALRERVTFEPENRVLFERVACRVGPHRERHR